MIQSRPIQIAQLSLYINMLLFGDLEFFIVAISGWFSKSLLFTYVWFPNHFIQYLKAVPLEITTKIVPQG